MKTEVIEHVFGHGRLRMATGEHVEVFREAVSGNERRRYTKRFLATDNADFRQWTEREWRILARLIGHGVHCVPDVVQFDGGVTGGMRQVQTYDAGVTVDQWATLLPVMRDGVVRRHVFEDCAHWWALAHHCLAALDEIHALALVHLDVKADNICVPYGPAEFDPAAGRELHAQFDRLALIDFAFSLVSREKLATALPIGWQKDYDYQSPRLLRALEAGRGGDLRPTQELDWRCDLYSLAAMLRRYLPEDGWMRDGGPASGWTAQRYDDARGFVYRLRESHDRDLPAARPHAELMEISGAYLLAPDLARSLREGWLLAPDVEVTSGAALATPLTRIAVARTLVTPPTAIRVAPLAPPPRHDVPSVVAPMVFTPVPSVMRRPRLRPAAPITVAQAAVAARANVSGPSPHRGMITAMVASLVAAMAVATPSFVTEPPRVEAPVVAKPEIAPTPSLAPASSAAPTTPSAAAQPASPPTASPALPAAAPAQAAGSPAQAAGSPAQAAGSPAQSAASPTPSTPAAPQQARASTSRSATPASAEKSSRNASLAALPAPRTARERARTPASPPAAGKASVIAAIKASPRAAAHESPHSQPAVTEASVIASATPVETPAPTVATMTATEPPSSSPAAANPAPIASPAAAPAPSLPAPSDTRIASAQPRTTPSPVKPAHSDPFRNALHEVLKLFGAVAQRPVAVEDRSAPATRARPAQQPPVVASIEPQPRVLASPAPVVVPPPPVAQPNPGYVAQPDPPPIATSEPRVDDLAEKGRRMLVDMVPRVAAQANADAYPVLWSASIANSTAQNRAVQEAAYTPWRSERAYPLDADDAVRARTLYDQARQAFAAGRDADALERTLRGFAANPRDPDLAGFLAFLHLQMRPSQPERARQLALHALAFSGSRRGLRLDDWNTLAVASALAGREVDASRAFLVALALSDDAESTCRSALRAYATFGPRLRVPVESLLQRAHAQGRDYDAPACAGTTYRTLARGL